MGRFTNKIVVITGGTSGIGLAAARQSGARLYFGWCLPALGLADGDDTDKQPD
jgi:hypothetical protein